MKNIKRQLTAGFLCVAMGAGTVLAQNDKTLSGVVTDENGKPIAGAVVAIPGTLEMTTTDADGRFFLNSEESSDMVKCNFIGYKDAMAKVSNGHDIKIVLQSDIAYRDEQLEVGMGRTERKLSYTGAISTVKANDLEKAVATGINEAIAGKMSGVITQASNGLASNLSFVRGKNSLNGNGVLVVMDGVPAPTLDLNQIDPATVESVSVLKDAAAKALYGPKAAQGVILVNTKRGKLGKMDVDVRLNYAFDKPTYSPKRINSYTYATLRNQALQNDGSPLMFTQSQIDAFANGTGVDNDWADMFLNSNVATQRYSIDLRGGNNRVAYYVNAGFVRQDGVYEAKKQEKFDPRPYDNRFTVVSNVDVNIHRYLKASLSTDVRISRTNESRGGSGSIYTAIRTMPATVEGPLVDGKVVTNEYFENPIYGMINLMGTNNVTTPSVNLNLKMELDMDFLTKGLKAYGFFGYQSESFTNIVSSRDYVRYLRDTQGNWVPFGSHLDTPLTFAKGMDGFYFLNASGTVEYSRVFDDVHSVDAFVNYFAEDRMTRDQSTPNLLPYDRIQLSGHVKYGYDDRYFVQGDFTYAGSEQFAKGNRFHFSPTVSGAWVVSNESFLQDVDWLDFLKIRASYGALKSDNLYSFGRFLYEPYIRQLNGQGLVNNLFGSALVQESASGNPKLTWEESRQQNYGIDFSFLKAFNLSVDYWHTSQRDIVLRRETTPELIGYSTIPYENVGEIVNRGVDVELGYTKKFANGLELTAKGNLGYSKSKVIDIDELNRAADNYAYPYRKTGYAIGQSFGYLVDYSNGNGYFNSAEELAASGLRYTGIQPRVGDLRFQDLNGDGVIDTRDQAPLGNSKDVPEFAYGVSVDMAYKGFDFYALFQGIAGMSNIYSGNGIKENGSQGVYNEQHLHAWTAERYAAGEEITYPALTASNSSSLATSDFFLSSANFIRLKNLVIGYSLPQRVVEKMHLDKFRVFVSGENLLTFTDLKYDGFDPESMTTDARPVYRAFNIGVNVNF